MRKIVLLLALLATLAVPVAALDIEPFVGYTDLRSRSMGGFHAALADDFSVLFTNPAGLAAMKPAFAASRIDLALAGPIFEMGNLVLSTPSADLTSAILTFLADNNYRLYTGLDLSGPISIGYVGEGLGFGVFQRTKLVINASGVSSIKVAVDEDFLINGGYAFRIPTGDLSSLDLGLVAKGYVRMSVGIDGGLLELSGLLTNPLAIITEPMTLTTGIGVDAGVRWNWKEIVALGLACRDLYSPAVVTAYNDGALAFFSDPASASPSAPVSATLGRELDFGIMVKPPLGIFGRIFDGVTFTADYLDILDLLSPLPRNPILNTSLGCEFRVLDILALRVGIKDALLEAGAEFDLGFATVGVGAWGRELGSEPGQRPVYNLELALDFVY
jgi:hypothetical protein